MSDALGSVLDLILTATVWRVVGEVVRDLPFGVQLAAGLAAAVLLVLVRRASRGRRRRGAVAGR